LNGLAFRTTDAAGLQSELGAAGKSVTEWGDFSRPVDVEGTEKSASFRTFQLGKDAISNGRFFFCQHNTPDLVWQAGDQNHPNGVLNIVDVFIVSRAPQAITELLAGFPNTAAPKVSKNGIAIQAGIVTLHIISEDHAASRFGSAIPRSFEGNERCCHVKFLWLESSAVRGYSGDTGRNFPCIESFEPMVANCLRGAATGRN
jgi:hypothetical protein